MGLYNPTKLISITKDDVYKKITELQIFEYYLGTKIKLPITIISPFRKEKRPSFCIYATKNNKIVFEDKATGNTGTAIDLVMQLFNLTFQNALTKIYNDFNVSSINTYVSNKISYTNETKKLSIVPNMIQNKPVFTKIDIQYWNKYNISEYVLKKHNVFSANLVMLNKKIILKYTSSNPIFAYVYKYNNIYYYKIYQPYAKPQYKFLNDLSGISHKILHGIHLLPKSGNILIITKSAKDCMVLNTCGYNSIAVQSESQLIPQSIITKLQQQWKTIYILFDNDYIQTTNWGQQYAQKLISTYNFINNIFIPTKYECKDISDFIHKYEFTNTKKLINNLIQHDNTINSN